MDSDFVGQPKLNHSKSSGLSALALPRPGLGKFLRTSASALQIIFLLPCRLQDCQIPETVCKDLAIEIPCKNTG